MSPPILPDADRAFLVTQKQVDASYHKNISYRPLEDRLKGIDQDDPTRAPASMRSCVATLGARLRSWNVFEPLCRKLEN